MNENQSITKLGKHFFSCKRKIKELKDCFMIAELLMDEGMDKEYTKMVHKGSNPHLV